MWTKESSLRMVELRLLFRTQPGQKYHQYNGLSSVLTTKNSWDLPRKPGMAQLLIQLWTSHNHVWTIHNPAGPNALGKNSYQAAKDLKNMTKHRPQIVEAAIPESSCVDLLRIQEYALVSLDAQRRSLQMNNTIQVLVGLTTQSVSTACKSNLVWLIC